MLGSIMASLLDTHWRSGTHVDAATAGDQMIELITPWALVRWFTVRSTLSAGTSSECANQAHWVVIVLRDDFSSRWPRGAEDILDCKQLSSYAAPPQAGRRASRVTNDRVTKDTADQ